MTKLYFSLVLDLTQGLLASCLNLVCIIKGCQCMKISMPVTKFTPSPDSLAGSKGNHLNFSITKSIVNIFTESIQPFSR